MSHRSRCWQFHLHGKPPPTTPYLLKDHASYLQWIVHEDHIVGFVRFRLGRSPSKAWFKKYDPYWDKSDMLEWIEMTSNYTGDGLFTYRFSTEIDTDPSCSTSIIDFLNNSKK